MTIPSGTSGVSRHVGNGVADTFDYDFKITDESELLVTTTDTAGTATVLTLTTDYTVTGVGNNSGGQITLVAGALTTGYDIAIEDNVEASQETPFGNQSSFFGINHENALDKLTRLVRRALERTANSLHLPSNITGVTTSLGEPVALSVPRMNAAANAFELVPQADIVSDAQSGFRLVKITTTAGQTALDLGSETYTPGINQVFLVANGSFFAPDSGHFTETDTTTITLAHAFPTGTDVFVLMGVAKSGTTAQSFNIGYNSGGTGALDTDVQTRLRKIYYSSGYSSLQAAATAAAGQRLIIDQNESPTATVTVPDDTEITSMRGFTVSTTTTLGNGFAVFQSGDDCKFDRIKFTGTALDEAGYCAIDTTGKNNVDITWCNVSGYGEAFLVQNSDNVRVQHNTIDGTHRWSVMFARSSNCRADFNVIKNSVASDGIKVNGNMYDDATDYENTHLYITHNICTGNARDGIDVASGCDSIHIYFNDCFDNTLNGIECKAHKTSVTAQRIFIHRNNALSNDAHGIRIDDVSKSEVTNNTSESNGDEGILAQNAISETTIAHNKSIGNANNGIRLQGDATVGTTEDVDINDNKCLDNGTSGGGFGILLGSYLDDIRVRSNDCYQRSSGKTGSGISFITSGATSITGVKIERNYCPDDKLDGTSNAPISMGSWTGDGVWCSKNVTHSSTVFTFDANDTTPEVAGGNDMYVTANTVATSITGFDQNSYEMDEFTVHVNDANTTFVQGSNLKLNGSPVNWAAPQGSMITFRCRNNVFYETGRMAA